MTLARAKTVLERYRNQIISVPEVVGISTGMLRKSGEAQPCIRVYLRKSVERGRIEEQKIPWNLDGIQVEVIVTGDIVAFDGH